MNHPFEFFVVDLFFWARAARLRFFFVLTSLVIEYYNPQEKKKESSLQKHVCRQGRVYMPAKCVRYTFIRCDDAENQSTFAFCYYFTIIHLYSTLKFENKLNTTMYNQKKRVECEWMEIFAVLQCSPTIFYGKKKQKYQQTSCCPPWNFVVTFSSPQSRVE